MDNIHILCISDIHFGKYDPENQALVLNEFFSKPPVTPVLHKSDF